MSYPDLEELRLLLSHAHEPTGKAGFLRLAIAEFKKKFSRHAVQPERFPQQPVLDKEQQEDDEAA